MQIRNKKMLPRVITFLNRSFLLFLFFIFCQNSAIDIKNSRMSRAKNADYSDLDAVFKYKSNNASNEIEEMQGDYNFVQQLGSKEDVSASQPLMVCLIFPSNKSMSNSLQTAQKVVTMIQYEHKDKKRLSFLFLSSGNNESKIVSASEKATKSGCDAVITTSVCPGNSCLSLFNNNIPVFSLNPFDPQNINVKKERPMFFAVTDAADDYIPALEYLAKSKDRLDVLFVLDDSYRSSSQGLSIRKKMPSTIEAKDNMSKNQKGVPLRISGIVHKPSSSSMYEFFKREISRMSCKTYLVAKDGSLYQERYSVKKSPGEEESASDDQDKQKRKVCSNVIATLSKNTSQMFATINMLKRSGSIADNAIVIGSSATKAPSDTSNISAVGLLVPFYSNSNIDGFESKYISSFSSKPRPFAPVLYDIVNAIIETKLVINIPIQEISKPLGFKGVTGIFGFAKDGRLLREYVVQSLSLRGFLPMETISYLQNKEPLNLDKEPVGTIVS